MDIDENVTIEFEGNKYNTKKGSNLRKALLEHSANLYNGKAKYLNCRGLGSCGTCAIEVVKGKVNSPTKIEMVRKNIYPHTPDSILRFACQIKVNEDVTIKKFNGFWGTVIRK